MYFKRIEASYFRNLTSVSIHPSQSLNVITGENGSGKSSLLESIFYLSTGSSFRTSRLNHLIKTGNDCFTLFSELDNEVSHKIGLQRCRKLNHLSRIDGKEISKRSELVQLIPLQVISPDSISLLTEGSEQRRNFLNWSLFHVEQSFHFHSGHYHRALKQRNALLKQASTQGLELWDQQLVEHGVIIDRMRKNYLETIKPIVIDIMGQLLPEIELDIAYRSGWSKELDLLSALESSRQNDLKMHHTTVGPHRGDVTVRYQGHRVSDILSRGQIKLTSIAFKLAQIIGLRSVSNKIPIILIDDMAAELDIEHRSLLLDSLRNLDTQIFITTPDLNLINFQSWDENKVFHVEHGEVKEVV